MYFPADLSQSKPPLQEVPQEDLLLTLFGHLIDHQALLEEAHLEHHPGDHPEDPKEDSPECDKTQDEPSRVTDRGAQGMVLT